MLFPKSIWKPSTRSFCSLVRVLRKRGGIRIWTGDLLICSQMLYHWAIPPPADAQHRWCVHRLITQPRVYIMGVYAGVCRCVCVCVRACVCFVIWTPAMIPRNDFINQGYVLIVSLNVVEATKYTEIWYHAIVLPYVDSVNLCLYFFFFWLLFVFRSYLSVYENQMW